MKRALKERPHFWKKHLRRAAAIRAETNISQYTEAEKVLVDIMVGAKQRCSTVHGVNHINYGGRGIEFRFVDVKTAAFWIRDNLGFKPSPKHSIDRIDNNGHYEPGNLRWATVVEQARNKREYKNGTRMRKLRKLRPDYSKQGIYKFIDWGWTDEQIIQHKKGAHVRKRYA